jgi:hypothetical protein
MLYSRNSNASERFKNMDISVNIGLQDLTRKPVSVVDVGLMAQVYANLF